MVSARGVLRTEGFPYALDNGAWTAYQEGEGFDAVAFCKALTWARSQPVPDFIVVPDIVGAGRESLAFSLGWIERLDEWPLLLLAVQDGMGADHLRPYLSKRVGIFLGGTTDWKLETMRLWGRLAREVACYFHVGRVNSVRRIRYCQDAGAHSFDGSAASRYAVELSKLDHGRRQVPLWRFL